MLPPNWAVTVIPHVQALPWVGPLTSFYLPLGLSASSPNGSCGTAGSCRCGISPPRSLSQRSAAACFASLCHAGNARLPHPGQSQSSWYRRGTQEKPRFSCFFFSSFFFCFFATGSPPLNKKKQEQRLSTFIIKKNMFNSFSDWQY